MEKVDTKLGTVKKNTVKHEQWVIIGVQQSGIREREYCSIRLGERKIFSFGRSGGYSINLIQSYWKSISIVRTDIFIKSTNLLFLCLYSFGDELREVPRRFMVRILFFFR